MNAERWNRVKQLLDQAISFDAAERASFLDRECGADAELRSEVASLLSSHQQAGSGFLGEPVINLSGNAATAAAPAPERRMGAYQLVEEIGHGGMGEVYRAVRADGEYRKEVAVKLIRGGFESPSLIERFRDERQILASLDHPNIARLLDGGTIADGVPYLVMDLIEGVSIERYCDDHRLSITERLVLFRKACEAVQYAHQQLVIHRDIKPSNILVTEDGIPKLLDFGIAKLLDPAGRAGTTLTRPMTPEYASPEQIRGDPVTAATDVYSLGVVLYQLLTGRLPYPGDTSTPHGLARAICEEDPIRPSTIIFRDKNGQPNDASTPERISHTREDSPEKLYRRLRGDLDNIVLTALGKEPSQRYASVEEFSEDIRRHLEHIPVLARKATLRYRASKLIRRHRTGVAASAVFVTTLAVLAISVAFVPRLHWDRLRHLEAAGSEIHRIESLAVLPLQNLSKDPEQEYFSDGMTDQLITDLAKVGQLKVISRTSVQRYKQTKRPLPEIARELGVDAIVEGTVLRANNRVRITAQLIDAHSDRHLWAESYERELGDVLVLQGRLAQDIAQGVRIKLTPQAQSSLTNAGKTTPAAYDAYLRGRFLWLQRNAEATAKAMQYFQQAVREDPNFASAYSGLADCYLVVWGRKPNIPLAEKYARKALSLDPDLAEAHASIGLVLFHEHQMSDAGNELRRALELNPNSAFAHHSYAAYLLSVGRLADALAESDRARQIDPFSAPINTMRAMILTNSRKYDEALDQAVQVTEIIPQSHIAYQFLSRIYWLKGQAAQAIEAQKKTAILAHAPQWLKDQGAIAKTYEESGLRAALLRAAQLMEQTHSSDFDGMWAALAYGGAQDDTAALRCLERTGREGDVNLELWLQTAPEFDFLRNDPRYLDMVRRLGFEPTAAAQR